MPSGARLFRLTTDESGVPHLADPTGAQPAVAHGGGVALHALHGTCLAHRAGGREAVARHGGGALRARDGVRRPGRRARGGALVRKTRRGGAPHATSPRPVALLDPTHSRARRARLTDRAGGGNAVTGRRSGAWEPVARSRGIAFRVRDGVRRPGRRAGGGAHPGGVPSPRRARVSVGAPRGVGVVRGGGSVVQGNRVGGGVRAEGGGELGEADVVRVLLVHVNRDPPGPVGVGRHGAGASAAHAVRVHVHVHVHVRNAYRHPARRARVRR
ncbi:hypothetical protein SVIO_019250 [Streptomyces violaceusniger]|uniref:Uncharacterized protein n=1 Tax=Streptomyces violaceusniger TaxID=68280 RepID=A0A4D4KRK7_STRVO|nr:hypothetical protein SVIO_019250 [Streptomyces violaceusniger]